jgi:hypothetical protein
MVDRDQMEIGLKSWIESNLHRFLTTINSELIDEAPWEMPVVEDFVLVVAVKDLSDDLGGTFAIASENSSSYRIRGLIADVLGH